MTEINRPVTAMNGDENTILFTGNGIMMNAMQMAVPFDKRPANWLRLASAKQFLSELSKVKQLPVTELVKKTSASASKNKKQIIWLHEDVALEFARWLSPAFAVWSNFRVKELLLTGKTNMNWREEGLPLPNFNLLMNKVTQLQDSVHEQARKVEYHDAILQSQTLIPATIIAKELGMSAIALNRLLHDKKVIYKNGKHWVLYSEYQGKEYTGTKTAMFTDSQGRYQSNIHTYWTEKGREFIHSLCKETKLVA